MHFSQIFNKAFLTQINTQGLNLATNSVFGINEVALRLHCVAAALSAALCMKK